MKETHCLHEILKCSGGGRSGHDMYRERRSREQSEQRWHTTVYESF